MSRKWQLGYRARRRWSFVVLIIGLPLYVALAVSIVGFFDRPSIWLELLIYVGLGVIWTIPLRFVFRGVGREDPDGPGGR
jgi:hypothetical protein